MALSPYLNKPVRSLQEAANDVRLDRKASRKDQEKAARKSRARSEKMLQRVRRLVS